MNNFEIVSEAKRADKTFVSEASRCWEELPLSQRLAIEELVVSLRSCGVLCTKFDFIATS